MILKYHSWLCVVWWILLILKSRFAVFFGTRKILMNSSQACPSLGRGRHPRPPLAIRLYPQSLFSHKITQKPGQKQKVWEGAPTLRVQPSARSRPATFQRRGYWEKWRRQVVRKDTRKEVVTIAAWPLRPPLPDYWAWVAQPENPALQHHARWRDRVPILFGPPALTWRCL